MAKFFKIRPITDLSILAWADRNWDTYWFDYDRERAKRGELLAWSVHSDGDSGLADALEADGITYSTFEGDPATLFS